METVEIEMPPEMQQRIRDMAEVYGLWEDEMVQYMIGQYLACDPHGLVEAIDVDEDRIVEQLSELVDRREQRVLASSVDSEERQ